MSTSTPKPTLSSLPYDQSSYDLQAIGFVDGATFVGFAGWRDGDNRDGEIRLLMRQRKGEEWSEVFHRAISPRVIERKGKEFWVGLPQGFQRFEAIALGKGRKPNLYVPVISLQRPCILQISPKGKVTELPNTLLGDKVPVGHVMGFGKWMVGVPLRPASWTERAGGDSQLAALYLTTDPATGEWKPAAEAGFGNPANSRVVAVQGFGERLYAATLNQTQGFELWAADAKARLPLKWVRVLSAGAARFAANPLAVSMTVFKDALYLGTASLPLLATDIGEQGPEIIRVGLDGRWDVVVGASRFSPDGLKIPLSGHGPGFGDQHAGAFVRLLAQSDRILAVYQGAEPSDAKPLGFHEYCGRPKILSSEDGHSWTDTSDDWSSKFETISAATVCGTDVILGGRRTQSDQDGVMVVPDGWRPTGSAD